MSSKHLTLRMDPQLFEEIEALKPEGMSMSSFLVQLIEQGRTTPSVHEDRAAREVQINAAVNQRQYDEMTNEERREQTDSFRLAHGHITFSQIVEKHKVELEKKYG